jgi:hypothetical protein
MDQKQKNEAHKLVKDLLIALHGAFNKISLYPKNHIIYKTSLDFVKSVLEKCLNRYGNIQLEIQKGQIRYEGEIVYQGKLSEENLAFILFRDGILRVTFQKDIELWEIHAFLEILAKHRILTEDAEDDIVTSLWELDLPSIRYEAADIELDDGSDLEHFHNIFETDRPSTECQESDSNFSSQGQDNHDCAPPINLAFRKHQHTFFDLTPEEREKIRKMVAEEETWEGVDYVIDVMLYILQQQTQPDNFSETIDFIAQELKEAFHRRQFNCANTVLKILRKKHISSKSENHWTTPLLERFFATISGDDFLSVLCQEWTQIENCDQLVLKSLKQCLLLLDAKAILTLSPMLLKTNVPDVQRMLMEVIGMMAKRNFGLFEKLLTDSQEPLPEKLIPILGALKNERSQKILFTMLHHDSERIRREALKILLARNAGTLEKVFRLIDDPDERVRWSILEYLGRHRNDHAENLLLDYLKRHRYRIKDTQHLYLVHQTLGKCGSDRSIPFLEKALFMIPVFGIPRFTKSKLRQAAVMALKELRTEKANLLLAKNSGNIISNVCQAFLSTSKHRMN